MKLFFFCSRRRQGFWAAQWSAADGLRVRVDGQGHKQLQGTILVNCPLCGEQHSYRAEEIPCPLDSQPEPA